MPKQFLKKTKIKPFSYIMVIALLSVVGYTASLTSAQITSAVTYQTGVGVSFTFNPKLTLTLSSSNLVISNLAPGTSDNSNEIAITVSTNAAYGYNLSATVGNSTTYNNTDLTHTSGVSSGKFTSIAFESNPANYISSISSNNTWGYSIDSGTKYNGLPLYSDTTNIATLKSTDTTPATGTDTVNFLIGAKASTTQPTGDYKNVINFMAVTNPTPMSLEQSYAAANKTKYNGYYKIQDMNPSICAAAELEDDILQVIDTRDDNIYKISKLKDGNCWMLDNLRLDPTDPTTAANMSETNTNAPAAAISNYLNGGNPDSIQYWTSAAVENRPNGFDREDNNNYKNPQIHSNKKDEIAITAGDGSGKIGVYYNYCAASAGTSCYDDGPSQETIINDICPKNWHIPTGGGYDGPHEYQNLYNAYMGATPNQNTAFSKALSITLSGSYDRYDLRVNEYGNVWSSSRQGSVAWYLFAYTYQNNFVPNPGGYSASVTNGYSVRCVSKQD